MKGGRITRAAPPEGRGRDPLSGGLGGEGSWGGPLGRRRKGGLKVSGMEGEYGR